ncbi:hypothetical protein D3C75_805330 [compost metagenome]
MICGVQSSKGDALIAAIKTGMQAVAGLQIGWMLFGATANSRHGTYGFDRISASRALSGQHHRVGVIQHRVRYVRYFGTRWHRVGYHRLHHLRRNDYRFVVATSVKNDLFLDAYQLGITDFDA